MSIDRIVCLANSYKHEHRCVAGISLRSKRWVRLIGNEVRGCLTVMEASYQSGGTIELLDVFEAQLSDPCESRSHPEDIRVGKALPFHIRKFNLVGDHKFLASFAAKSGTVLQGFRDRMPASSIERKQIARSIELVSPEDLWWWIRNDGKRKSRALFRSGRTRFDLAVTDPSWLHRLAQLDPGIYPHSFFFTGNLPKTYLTVSLTEAFERFHYKVVAGVICLTQAGDTGESESRPDGAHSIELHTAARR